MNDALASVLQQLRAGLESQYGYRLDRVLLYGSQARGDAGPESDVDVLVVLRGEVDPVAELHRAGHLSADLSLENDLVILCLYMSEDEFAHGDDLFLRNIRREGVVIERCDALS
jgi:predicted nucleotidyltransferase